MVFLFVQVIPFHRCLANSDIIYCYDSDKVIARSFNNQEKAKILILADMVNVLLQEKGLNDVFVSITFNPIRLWEKSYYALSYDDIMIRRNQKYEIKNGIILQFYEPHFSLKSVSQIIAGGLNHLEEVEQNQAIVHLYNGRGNRQWRQDSLQTISPFGLSNSVWIRMKM